MLLPLLVQLNRADYPDLDVRCGYSALRHLVAATFTVGRFVIWLLPITPIPVYVAVVTPFTRYGYGYGVPTVVGPTDHSLPPAPGPFD